MPIESSYGEIELCMRESYRMSDTFSLIDLLHFVQLHAQNRCDRVWRLEEGEGCGSEPKRTVKCKEDTK